MVFFFRLCFRKPCDQQTELYEIVNCTCRTNGPYECWFSRVNAVVRRLRLRDPKYRRVVHNSPRPTRRWFASDTNRSAGRNLCTSSDRSPRQIYGVSPWFYPHFTDKTHVPKFASYVSDSVRTCAYTSRVQLGINLTCARTFRVTFWRVLAENTCKHTYTFIEFVVNHCERW